MSTSPHGGRLINRYAGPAEADGFARRAIRMKSWQPTERELTDLEMIASGAFSPLTGFLGQNDFHAVLDRMRLASGEVWSLPVTLAVSKAFGSSLGKGEEIALTDSIGEPIAVCTVADVYGYDRLEYARKAFKTADEKHPAVADLFTRGPLFVGGDIVMLKRRTHAPFAQYRHEPREVRERMESMGWKTAAGFQTRNPVHRAHEYIQKCALEIVDGLLLHPVVGQTKGDDVPAELRVKCYEALIKWYFPGNRVLLSVNPAYMRYAGPREAVFHAIVRKNFGCTHFIVGRDHAGVGNFYGPFEAQEVFSQFQPGELGITPLFFDNAFYCKACGGMATTKTCPHGDKERISLSGSMVRDMLRKGEPLPQEFTRAEIGAILKEAYQSKQD